MWKVSTWSVHEASFVACADGGANRLYDFYIASNNQGQYIPNIIHGDFDSVRPKILEYYKNKGARAIKSHCQETTDLDKCIIYINQNVEDIDLLICYNAFGGRFDQQFAAINSLVKYADLNFQIILLEEGNLVELLMPGEHHIICNPEFEPIGMHCGLVPLGSASSVYTTGLKWNLEGDAMEFGGLISTNNVTASSTIYVKTSHPLIWTSSFEWIIIC